MKDLIRDHNTIIPLVGGPLCGESLTMKNGRIPNSVPVFNDGKFYVYSLFLQQNKDWTTLYYEYNNEVLEVCPKLDED
jgi:hypothetical protein